MDKKILSVFAAIALLLILGFAYLQYRSQLGGSGTAQTQTPLQTFTGAMVGEGSTTITLSQNDGTIKTFDFTNSIPVYSQVATGTGMILQQISAGDILTITYTGNKTAKSIEVVPAEERKLPQSAQTITGIVQEVNPTGITLKDSGMPPGMAQIAPSVSKIAVHQSTSILTQTLGAEPSRQYSDIRPGDSVRIFEDPKANAPTATVVEILRR